MRLYSIYYLFVYQNFIFFLSFSELFFPLSIIQVEPKLNNALFNFFLVRDCDLLLYKYLGNPFDFTIKCKLLGIIQLF